MKGWASFRTLSYTYTSTARVCGGGRVEVTATNRGAANDWSHEQPRALLRTSRRGAHAGRAARAPAPPPPRRRHTAAPSLPQCTCGVAGGAPAKGVHDEVSATAGGSSTRERLQVRRPLRMHHVPGPVQHRTQIGRRSAPVCKVAPHKVVEQAAGLAKVKPGGWRAGAHVWARGSRWERVQGRQASEAVTRTHASPPLGEPRLPAVPGQKPRPFSPLVRRRDVGRGAVQRRHHPALGQGKAVGGPRGRQVCRRQAPPLGVVHLRVARWSAAWERGRRAARCRMPRASCGSVAPCAARPLVRSTPTRRRAASSVGRAGAPSPG